MSPKLSRRVRQLLSDPGKLDLPAATAAYIPAKLKDYGMEALPVTLEHVLAASTLPAHHRDPFDRMLVAQGQVERLPIVTQDSEVQKYAVETIW
jgi:PIN domain nuclease of toxin-antitoxin system